MNRLGLALLVVPALAMLAGCPKNPDPNPCTIPFVGDMAVAPELEAWVVGLDGRPSAPLADGMMVPITEPPQGGRVIFVGIRARNIDACEVQLKGVLRNLETQRVTLDDRTVNLTTSGESTVDEFSTLSNISVCENNWSASDVFGHTYELEVSIEDRGGRKAMKKLRVVPFCAEADKLAECMCICSKDYMGSCPTDGGI